MRITNDSIKKMRHPSTMGAPDKDDATFQIKLYSIYSSNKLLMSSLTQLFSCTANGRKRNSWFPRVRGKYFYALFNLAQRNQFMINSSCPVLSFILSQLCSALGCHFTRITEAFVVGGHWGGGGQRHDYREGNGTRLPTDSGSNPIEKVLLDEEINLQRCSPETSSSIYQYGWCRSLFPSWPVSKWPSALVFPFVKCMENLSKMGAFSITPSITKQQPSAVCVWQIISLQFANSAKQFFTHWETLTMEQGIFLAGNRS